MKRQTNILNSFKSTDSYVHVACFLETALKIKLFHIFQFVAVKPKTHEIVSRPKRLTIKGHFVSVPFFTIISCDMVILCLLPLMKFAKGSLQNKAKEEVKCRYSTCK